MTTKRRAPLGETEACDRVVGRFGCGQSFGDGAGYLLCVDCIAANRRAPSPHEENARLEPVAWAAYTAHGGPGPEADNIWPDVTVKRRWVAIVKAAIAAYERARWAAGLADARRAPGELAALKASEGAAEPKP